MKKKFKGMVSLGLAATLSLAGIVDCFAQIPQGYWQYQTPFQQAVTAKNNGEILRIGNEVIKLFSSQALDKDKAGILYNTYEKMYPVYESQGNYDAAIQSLNEVINYGEYLGFSDAVKLAKARIKKIDPMTEVYALTQNTSAIPYFGMKNEPKSGTYFGRVYTNDSEAPMAQETAVSFYVECFQENAADFDYMIRPYADGTRLLHIALNMPGENNSLKQVLQPQSDTYLNSTMEYLNSLNTPILLRIGGEMNVWQNLADADTYKQAYIKIANIARAKAPNVALVFSPNDISNWNVDIGDYYPGDAYVDWVGVSLYTDKFRNYANPVPVQDFEEMYYGNGAYSNPLTKLRDIVDRYGNKKPIIITEGGTGHSIEGKTVDLTAFAKNRIHMLYTYVNMLYPQVKAVIYFDVNLKNNKYVYALSRSPEAMAQYKTSTSNNQALIKAMGQTPYAYTKLGAYKDNLPTLKLFTYCILPGNILVKTEYFLDGQSIGSSMAIPFSCELDLSKVTGGAHELKAVIKGENGYSKTKTYQLVKEANGMVSVTPK